MLAVKRRGFIDEGSTLLWLQGLGFRSLGVAVKELESSYCNARHLRWILKILHDPKYLIPWEVWYHNIQGSCRIYGINSIPYYITISCSVTATQYWVGGWVCRVERGSKQGFDPILKSCNPSIMNFLAV